MGNHIQHPPFPIAILAGLYRYSKGSVRSPGGCPNFMNRRDPCFREAIQVRYHYLRETGVGAVVKLAALVTPDEENILWESKVIGDHSPLALQRAVFLGKFSVFVVERSSAV